MSNDTDIIKNFKISKRINEGATSFEINFTTPLPHDEFKTGEAFEFYIRDNTLDEDFTAITGMIEDIKRDMKDNNKIYSISGRDKGRLLLKQPFDLPCSADGAEKYRVENLLNMILVDTGISVGRGQTPLSEVIYLNTSQDSNNRFCGTFNTKQDAINQLFSQYSKLAGSKRFRWYVDYAGFLKWFEIDSERGGITYIFKDDDRVLSVDVEEDATNIVNKISGNYGRALTEEEAEDEGVSTDDDTDEGGVLYSGNSRLNKEYSEIGSGLFGGWSTLWGGDISNIGKDPKGGGTDARGNVTLINQASVNRFGICVGDDINESDYTRQEMIDALQRELDMKSWEIYTAKMVLSGLYSYEPGTQIMYPDDEDYSEKIFTVVDYEITGEIAEPKTTVNLTTDESAISVNNEFDVVQSTAKKEVNEAKSRVGVVVGIPDTDKDKCLVWIPTKNGGTIVSGRNPGGQWDV